MQSINQYQWQGLPQSRHTAHGERARRSHIPALPIINKEVPVLHTIIMLSDVAFIKYSKIQHILRAY